MADQDKPAARSGRDVSGDARRDDEPGDTGPGTQGDDKPSEPGPSARRMRDAAVEKVASHPLGAVAGGIGGAALGALGGVAAGPVGSLAGAIGGAIMGAGAGSDSSVATGPVVEGGDAAMRWRAHWQSRPWGESGARYEDYAVAYEYGADAAADAMAQGRGARSWSDIEPELERGWVQRRGTSPLRWDQVREAVHEAWQHVREVADRVPPGDLRR